MPFLAGPDLRYIGAGIYELTAPCVYQGASEGFTVPTGFRTDLASVPRPVQWLVPKDGTYEKAAVLHDWCCEVGIAAGLISAVDTDGLFRRVMAESGVDLLLRWLMWTGVRLGALQTSIRRPGWLSTAPMVVLLTLLLAIFVVPVSLLVWLGLAVFWVLSVAVELPARLGRRGRRADHAGAG
jgi:hypothetical protein